MLRSLHFALLPLLLCAVLSLPAQQRYWVFFKDKGPEASFLLQHPETFLAPEAIQRRAGLDIQIDEIDLPVSVSYIDALTTAGLQVHTVSKWLNAVTIESQVPLWALQQTCPSVIAVRPVGTLARHHIPEPQQVTSVPPNPSGKTTGFNYGLSATQVQQINMDCVHDLGYTGKNVVVTVMDGGFLNVDTYQAFDSMRANGRLIAYYDFVNNDNGIFDENSHGMSVLSIVGGLIPGQLIGTAPHAKYILCRTENVNSETHSEEDNWVRAMEWADSIGTDVIHSSLGYSTFDPGEGDYTYADMDGNTTIMTHAADLAASRGIIVTNSAGNEGAGAWYYITAACDGDSVLCVGAVDFMGTIASFSSRGPSSDGQIKPDVVAMGSGTVHMDAGGTISFGGGTSYSSPLIAGMVACLRQHYPFHTNMQIVDAVRQSADRSGSPDNDYGYGIPDGCKADSILGVMPIGIAEDTQGIKIGIFPNPASDVISIQIPEGSGTLTIISADGRLVQSLTIADTLHKMNVTGFPAGLYLVTFTGTDGQFCSGSLIIE